VLLRTSGDTMGGLPTLGGLGMLKSEDEPEFEYQEMGAAKILMTVPYQGADLVDRGDAIAAPTVQIEALIECIAVPGFEIHKNDLVAAMPGGGVVIAYEIVGMTSSVNIYPYPTKWVVAPRDDLTDLEPWQG
jgi:hypothetical protein